MPADFDRCVAQGGKVRTKRLNKDEYAHVCVLNGKSFMGYPKKYKRLSRAQRKA